MVKLCLKNMGQFGVGILFVVEACTVYAHLGVCAYSDPLLTMKTPCEGCLAASFTLQCARGRHSLKVLPRSFYRCSTVLLSKRFLFVNRVEYLRTLLLQRVKQTQTNLGGGGPGGGCKFLERG